MKHPIVAFMTHSKVGLAEGPGGERDGLRFDAVEPRGDHLWILRDKSSRQSVWVGVLRSNAELGLWIERFHERLFAPAFECVGPPATDLRRAKAFRRAYCESLEIGAGATGARPDSKLRRRTL